MFGNKSMVKRKLEENAWEYIKQARCRQFHSVLANWIDLID